MNKSYQAKKYNLRGLQGQMPPSRRCFPFGEQSPRSETRDFQGGIYE